MQYTSKTTYSSRSGQPSWSAESSKYGNIQLGSKQTFNENYTQLDALLDDLKLERERQTENDHTSTITRTTDRKMMHTLGSAAKTDSFHPNLQSEMIDVENLSTSGPRSISSPNNYRQKKTFHNEYVSKKYELGSQNIYEDKSSFNESRSFLKSELNAAPTVATTSVGHLEQSNLNNIVVTDDLLPRPGTKVTTTVRTYTYEIPVGVSTNAFNTSQQSYKVNTSQLSEINNKDYLLSNAQLPEHQTAEWNTKSVRNIAYSKQHDYTDESSHTYKNRTLQERNINIIPSDTTTTTEKVYQTTTRSNNLKGNFYCPLCNTFVHSTNANNHICELYSANSELRKSNNNNENYNSNILPFNPNAHHSPVENDYIKRSPISYTPTAHSYTYSSTKVYPQQDRVITPFPVDYTDGKIYPTEKPNDLLAPNEFYNKAEKPLTHDSYQKKELETAVATPDHGNSLVKKTATDVYYPPKYEMSTEKRSAEWSGGGQWAKASGSAERSSGSKFKTKTKSGGAIVPVCLPLCCAMPCSIM